jgi:hypothetical protein
MPEVTTGGSYGRAVALAWFFLLPAAVLATASISCGAAGGGAERCLSLTAVTVVAYPLWLAYALPTGIAAYRGMPDWRLIAVINVFAGWTLMGWIYALIRATETRPEAGLPAEPALPTVVPWTAEAAASSAASGTGLVVREAGAAYDARPPRDAVATDGLVANAPRWMREGEWPSSALLVRLCGAFGAYYEGERISKQIVDRQSVWHLWLSMLLRWMLDTTWQARREGFADEMSPGLDSESQNQRLRNRIRGLKQGHPAFARHMRADATSIAFAQLGEDGGRVVVDVELLHAAAEQARRDRSIQAGDTARIRVLLEGCAAEVLPEWMDLDERMTGRRGAGQELVEAVRARHADDLATVSLAVAQSDLENGSAAVAVELLSRALEIAPGREDVARRLVAALTAAGRPDEGDRIRDQYLG